MEGFRTRKRTPSAWSEPEPDDSESVHGEAGEYLFEASPTAEVVDHFDEQFRLNVLAFMQLKDLRTRLYPSWIEVEESIDDEGLHKKY